MAATEVLRVRMLKALQAALVEIKIAAGYQFDMVLECVILGRSIFGDSDPLPLLTILEVPIPLDQIAPPEDSAYSSGAWELLIQGFIHDDKVEPTMVAHRLMADVKKRLAVEKKKNKDYAILGMGNHVTNMRIGAGVVRPPDEISSEAYFWLNLTLDVVEDLADPFED